MGEVIRIENLSKSYDGKKNALENLSINISSGKVILLAGENGAGKTTLFNLMVGQLKPDHGDIQYDMEYLEYSFKKISYCTQLLSIDWYLNVFDNVMLGSYFNYDTKRDAIREAKNALSLLRLTDFDKCSVEQLSGGQQQRVQIARAFASNPRIMLLDEPIVGLDVESSLQVMNKIKELVEEKEITVILSSHQLSLIENFCDEIVLLNSGKLLAHTTIKDFKEAYKNISKLVIELSDNIKEEDILSVSTDIIYCRGGNPIEILYKNNNIPNELFDKFGKNIKQMKKENLSLDDIFLVRNRG